MSALGRCGCVAFYAIYMAFKGWSSSLLICAGKAMDISIPQHCQCANTGMMS